MMMKASLRTCAVCLLCVLSGACGEDNPVAPTTRQSPATEVFTSNVNVQGSVWRMITAIQTGSFSATMTAADQPTIQLGMALGIRNGTGSGCLVTQEVIATAGPALQLTAQLEAGDYCVMVFDVGQLRSPMNFAVTINYP